MMHVQRKIKAGPPLRAMVFVLLVIFTALPFAQTVLLSFLSTMPRDGMVEGQWSLINYRNIFLSADLRGSILNSVLYVLLNVALCLIAGLPAAYAFSRYRFIGDRHLLFVMLAFRVMPPVVLSLPIFILFSQVNLVVARHQSLHGLTLDLATSRKSQSHRAAPFTSPV
jgi:glycerol transport system permease protein